jgi:hypothetical protein
MLEKGARQHLDGENVARTPARTCPAQLGDNFRFDSSARLEPTTNFIKRGIVVTTKPLFLLGFIDRDG